jgi:hypothetical protein
MMFMVQFDNLKNFELSPLLREYTNVTNLQIFSRVYDLFLPNKRIS